MIEELRGLGMAGRRVRIPPEMDVPLSPRITRLLDTATLRRLSRISQLGLVHLVYPGATHSRLEHSLGVYRNSLLVLQTLTGGDPPVARLGLPAAEAFVLAALLHDIGHWPFCHAIEDMRLQGLAPHEHRVAALIGQGELNQLIRVDWACGPDDVMSLLIGTRVGDSGLSDAEIEWLASCLSGPIDVDKLDYLIRDSLHAGVPYGRHFDASRLVAAMTIAPHRNRLAISEKGRTAAEMMVFARYVMFSEVYWHHTVRAATAMLQRSVFLLRDRVDFDAMLRLDEAAWIGAWRQAAERSGSEGICCLVEGLFGPVRSLYKRVCEYNVSRSGDLHGLLAHRPYWWLAACGERLARLLTDKAGLAVAPSDVLIDAPPVKLEVDINVDVVGSDGDVRPLAEVSPVADALAHQQFDGHVKRVRVFVRPDLRDSLKIRLADETWIRQAVELTLHEIA